MAGKMTPDEARQYLANVAASGETDWRPTKPLDEYKDDQVVRKAREFERMERAGLPLSNQVARGHGNQERGKAPELPTSKQNYDIVRGAERAGIDVSAIKSGDRYYPEFETSASNSEKAVDFLAGQVPNSRISIGYTGNDGNLHTIYSKGINVNTVQARADEFESFYDYIIAEGEIVYGSDEGSLPAPGTDFQIVVLSRK